MTRRSPPASPSGRKRKIEENEADGEIEETEVKWNKENQKEKKQKGAFEEINGEEQNRPKEIVKGSGERLAQEIEKLLTDDKVKENGEGEEDSGTDSNTTNV